MKSDQQPEGHLARYEDQGLAIRMMGWDRNGLDTCNDVFSSLTNRIARCREGIERPLRRGSIAVE